MSVHVPAGFFELLLNVKAGLCFVPGFYHPGSTTVNPLAIAYVNPLAGYFFSSTQLQSPRASHPAVQLNPERTGLFTCIPNQHKMFAVFFWPGALSKQRY